MIWNHDFLPCSVREPLQNVGQSFVIVKTLPIGIYHYRFIVDGYLTHAPEFPSAPDDSGYAYNILDLQVISWFTFSFQINVYAYDHQLRWQFGFTRRMCLLMLKENIYSVLIQLDQYTLIPSPLLFNHYCQNFLSAEETIAPWDPHKPLE